MANNRDEIKEKLEEILKTTGSTGTFTENKDSITLEIPLSDAKQNEELINAIIQENLRKAEEEAERRVQEELKRRAEEEARRKAAEEEARRKAAEEEARRKAAEEEARRKAAEEEARRKAAEEEAKRKAAEEEAKRKAAEEEARRKAAEEEARRKAAEEEAKRKAAEEEARRKAAEEEAKRKAAEEEAKRKVAEEEAKRKAAEEEARRKAAEEEAKDKAAEEEAKRMAAEEEARRKAAEEEAKRKAAEEEAKRKAAEEEARRKAAEEEAKRKATEEEAKRKAAEEEAKRKAAEEEAKVNKVANVVSSYKKYSSSLKPITVDFKKKSYTNNDAFTPNLKKLYNDKVRDALQKEFGYKSNMEIPRLEKCVVSVGCGDAVANKKYLDAAVKELEQITGQHVLRTKARKAIANFKIRQGMEIGAKVTLRSDNMWYFLERLISIALPRVRDFRGIKKNAFDGNGNYSLGITEQIIFPEIDFDKIERVSGLNVAIITTANTDKEAYSLLKNLGMPFQK